MITGLVIAWLLIGWLSVFKFGFKHWFDGSKNSYDDDGSATLGDLAFALFFSFSFSFFGPMVVLVNAVEIISSKIARIVIIKPRLDYD